MMHLNAISNLKRNKKTKKQKESWAHEDDLHAKRSNNNNKY